MTHTIGMISLGCAKNQVNAEHMLWLLRQAGYEISPDPDGAELVIVNTCGFIESAKTEAIDNILAMAQLKAEGRIQKILVTGCLAQRYQEEILKELPEVLFQLEIPPLMNVMSALALSLMVGLAITWTKSKRLEALLDEIQNVVLAIVSKIIIPLLPFFIASTFCGLAYEGTITKQFPVFIKVIIIVMVGHYLWMLLLYAIAGAYSGKNPIEVVKHYGPAYITAVGTMSSAATLAVALRCAKKSSVLRKDMVDFGIPLFANIHLCGSVLTEVFFVMTVSQILYGKIPSVGTMVLFCMLLGIFAIGAPGVPGGTVMASLGLITGILLFDGTGTALMLTIFALQDSFGTACNVTGDGALTLILTGYADRHKIAVAESAAEE